MSESSATPSTTTELLAECRDQLRLLADADHEQLVGPAAQLKAQNAIAAGVATLAGEPDPEPAVEEPTRPIMAKDLLLTVDLVLRALEERG